MWVNLAGKLVHKRYNISLKLFEVLSQKWPAGVIDTALTFYIISSTKQEKTIPAK